MANPTTNYGFVLPTPTDLVTDLPADFEVALQGVDTQMKTNADAATQKATLTTKGDIYAATAASTPARLAVGANDTVLTADSTSATGLKWATAGGAAADFTLLNSGGTALTGASTISITGISGKNSLIVVVQTASSTNANAFMAVVPNGTATTGKFAVNLMDNGSTTYNTQVDNQAYFGLGHTGNTASNTLFGSVFITGANSTNGKWIYGNGGGAASPGGINRIANGFWGITSAITSIDIVCFSGDFDNGTVFVYGSNN